MKRGRNQRRRQGVNPNRALDSNGPDVRIRGTANQIYDKYQALARDASSSGDRVKAENYLQHAEHYFRLIRSMQATQPQQHPSPNQTDVDSEQPSLDDSDNQREDRQERQERRYEQKNNNGHAANESSDDDGADAEEESAQEASGEGEDQARKPRRRRPRRAPKQSGDADGETEEPAAAAE